MGTKNNALTKRHSSIKLKVFPVSFAKAGGDIFNTCLFFIIKGNIKFNNIRLYFNLRTKKEEIGNKVIGKL